MVRFFAGNWSCSGELASGKKIEADVSFTPELDGKWLLYRHHDRAPGPFKALALWGVDQPSGNLVAVMQDNFGNARLFTSNEWKDGSITFRRAAMLDQKISQERFRYDQSTASGSWAISSYAHVIRSAASRPASVAIFALPPKCGISLSR